MRQTRDIALEELTAAGDVLAIPATRVDAAHSIGDVVADPPSLAEMPVDQAINELVRLEGAVQLKSQADQLAAHLNARQQELERREAQLNAEQAAFEQEVREARLWLAERDDQLNDREERLNRRETALKARQVNSEANARGGAPSGEGGGSFSSRRNATEGVPCRTDGPEITKPKTHAAPPAANHRRWEAEWTERKETLVRAREQLDRRRAALEKFWEESSRTRREALELRLLAQELLAQLKASLEVARVEEALAAVRQRLARRYRGEVDQLAERQHELDWLKNDLATEQERLERRYETLSAWVAEQRRLQATGDREHDDNAAITVAYNLSRVP